MVLSAKYFWLWFIYFNFGSNVSELDMSLWDPPSWLISNSLNPYLAEANPVHDVCPSAILPHTAPRSHTASVPIHFSDLHSTGPHRKQTGCRNMFQHPLNEMQEHLYVENMDCIMANSVLYLLPSCHFAKNRQTPSHTLSFQGQSCSGSQTLLAFHTSTPHHRSFLFSSKPVFLFLIRVKAMYRNTLLMGGKWTLILPSRALIRLQCFLETRNVICRTHLNKVN